MKLEAGKLYETVDGRRFRVTYNESSRVFECNKSYSGYWRADAAAFVEHMYRPEDNLVREVVEKRWVPINEYAIEEGMILSKVRGRHWQEYISRDEARRRDPTYNSISAQVKPVLNRVDVVGGISFTIFYRSRKW